MQRRTWTAWGCLLGVAVLAGCRDQDPPESFQVDLSTDSNERLLPMPVGFHGAHDSRIRQGGRVTIVKLADFDPSAPMPVAAAGVTPGATPELPPASSVEEALSNVGESLLGALLGGQGAGGADAAMTSTSGESGVASAEPGAGASAGAVLSPADVEALHALVERYGAARAERAFIDVPDLLVAGQRSIAVDYYDRLAELSATVTNLSVAFDRIEPGAKAAVDQQFSESLTSYELFNPAATDADTATGTVARERGAAGVVVTFRRESGFWRVVDPHVPASDQWESVSASLDGSIEALNDFDNSILEGKPIDAAQLRAALTEAVKLLAGGSAG